MKCRLVCPGSPNDGLLVESHGSPGYDISIDGWRDDWVDFHTLEDTRSWIESGGKRGAKAGTRSGIHKDKLTPVNETEI